jgi:conjugal transfer/type IV secretion protein DotA/TraY
MNLKPHSRAIKGAALLSFVFAMLVPALAMAQSAQTSAADYEPGANDLTVFMLHNVFGVWSSTAEVPVLGSAMRVLNLFALAFGTLMFTYVAVIGTLNSAQDGELLGRKWSSMWVPLRFVFGSAMLVPLASGYSTAQHLILWLAMVGGGGASAVWHAALQAFVSPNSAVTAVSQSQDYIQKTNVLARNVLQSEVCVAMLQKAATSGSFGMNASITNPVPASIANGGFGLVGGHRITWGGGVGSDKATDYCGTFTTASFSIPPNVTDPMTSSIYQTSGVGAAPSMAPATSMSSQYSTLSYQQFSGIQAAHNSLSQFAQALVADNSTATTADINAAVLRAASDYRDATQAAITAVGTGGASNLTRFVNSADDAGWMMASSSFFQLARIRSEANAVINTTPKYSKGETPSGTPNAPPGVAEGPLFEDMSAVETRINDSFAGDSSDKWYFNIGKRLAQNIGESFSVSPTNSDHALVQIKDKGDRLLVGLEAAGIAAISADYIAAAADSTVVGMVVNGATGMGKGILEVIRTLTPMMTVAFGALFLLACTMSFAIPMMPFVLSIGSVLGWLMAVFSAVVAAPVWLAGHLHPEGDGIAGRAAGGYMILLETVTRPIFIIFGLLGAFAIMDPVLKFVAWSFRANLSSVQGDSMTGIVSVVVFAVIYVTIVFTTVRQSLHMMYVLSETVYRWIGGQNAGMEQAREFNNAAEASSKNTSGQVQTAGGAMLGTYRKPAAKRASEESQANAGDPDRENRDA